MFLSLAAEMARRYGTQSQAYLSVHCAQLLELLEDAASGNEPFQWCAAQLQLEMVQSLFDELRVGTVSREHVAVEPGGRLLRFVGSSDVELVPIEFPVGVLANGDAIRQLSAGSHYLYVLTPAREIVLHPQPLAVQDLFFPEVPRRRRTRHPDLLGAPSPVLGAGEICWFGSARPRAVLLNNRSGHFMPPAASLGPASEACSLLFAVPDERVFTLRVGSDVE